MSNEIAKIEDIESLPALYAKNLKRATDSTTYTGLQLSLVDKVDILTVDASFMETALIPVVDLRAKLKIARDAIEAERKPFTSRMDDVKSSFIAIEKEFDANIARVSGVQNAWESEKARRKKVADKIKADEILEAKAKILRESELTSAINRVFSEYLSEKVCQMIDAFHAKKAYELSEFGKKLSEWIPTYTAAMHSEISGKAANGRFADLFDDVSKRTFNELFREWSVRLIAERDKLVDLVPSRITELTTEKPEVIAQRQFYFTKEIKAEIQSDTDAKAETNMMAAETAVLAAHFVEPISEDLSKAKGAVTKKIYVASSHKGFVAIIQNWIKTEMALLTPGELETKLSFMFTAANNKLNAKVPTIIESEGLTYIEVTSTRNQKQKKNASSV